jgi:hypothetical protein
MQKEDLKRELNYGGFWLDKAPFGTHVHSLAGLSGSSGSTGSISNQELL